MDVLPAEPPPKRTRKPRTAAGTTEAAIEATMPVSGTAPAELTPARTSWSPAAEPPVMNPEPSAGEPATPAVYPTSLGQSAPPAAPAAAAAPASPPAALPTPPPAAPPAPPLAPPTPAAAARRQARPPVPTVAASAPVTPPAPPAPPAAQQPPAAPPAPVHPPAPPAPPAPSAPPAAQQDDGSTGVRALQEAFKIDIAEREDRHRAELHGLQQSFAADIQAREDRHRSEVQGIQQSFAADIAARDDWHRGEVGALQQTIDEIRAQHTQASATSHRESEARATAEAELEWHRGELEANRGEVRRLNAQSTDLSNALTAARQQNERWTETARQLEADLETARADAERAAAAAAKQIDEKVRQIEDKSRQLEEMTRRRETADERNARLIEQSAAHEAAADQLRQTVAEQRTERERITGERDTARQQAAELEVQIRAAELESDQAADEASRQLNEAARRLDSAEEHAARATGQASVHEATLEELRTAMSEQQAELRKATLDRDGAKSRIADLEAEITQLKKNTPLERSEEPAPAKVEAPERAKPAEAKREPVVAAAPAAVESLDRPLSLAEDIELLAWQQEALASWARDGHRGVVEAISGADKTPVAYWAISEALDAEMKVLVVAPTAERVDQWFAGLRDALPINRVGKLPIARDERHASYDVVVCTVADAARESVFGTSFNGLIVADQVHELGTREMSPALDPLYAWRLGITASHERDDNGISTYLDPYFGGISFKLGYERALSDEVVAPFDIAIVSVRMNNAEQAEYDAVGKQEKELAGTLVGNFGVPPTERFTEAVAALASGRMGPARNAARAHQKAVAKRLELVANASAKAAVLRALAGPAREAGAALIYTENQQDAGQVAKVFAAQSCPTRTMASGSDRGLLRGKRADGGREEVCLLAGPDGTNPAEVSFGVIVGASGSKRQLTQRLGQVIRRRADGAHARLTVVYVEGTDQDDYSDDADAAIAGIKPYAARLSELSSSEVTTLVEFLKPAVAEDAPKAE